MVSLTQTISAMPVRDAPTAVGFYRDRLGFEFLHHDGGFAVLGRDEAVVHLWQAGDESWRERGSIERPALPVGREMSRNKNNSSTAVQPGHVRGQSPDVAGTAASGRDRA